MPERVPTPRQFSRALSALWTMLRVAPRYRGPGAYHRFAAPQLAAFAAVAERMELPPEARAHVLRHLEDALDAARRASAVRDRWFVRYVGRAMRRAAEAAAPGAAAGARTGWRRGASPVSLATGGGGPSPGAEVDLTSLRALLS